MMGLYWTVFMNYNDVFIVVFCCFCAGGDSSLPLSRASTVMGMCDKLLDGVYADPYDCNRFISCFSGFTYRRLCPPGTIWSERRRTCDYERNSDKPCVPSGASDTYQHYTYGTPDVTNNM